jgi:hypothetical protein
MPTLFRFLTVVGLIAGIGYGVLFALANFVNPKPREMTVTIPPDKFLRKSRVERFQAKWTPDRVKKARQNKKDRAPFRFYRNGNGSRIGGCGPNPQTSG